MNHRTVTPRRQRSAALLVVVALVTLMSTLHEAAASPRQAVDLAPSASPERSAPDEADAPSAVATASSARPLVGVVLEVEGRVRVRESAAAPWAPLAENDVLRPGAEVQSGLRSSAAIRLGSNATVLIGPGTSVVIPQMEEELRTLVTRLGVRNGRVDIRVDHVGIANDFRVVTPSTTLAVSGTALAVSSGRLVGTEVTGADTNRMAAIEVRWIARRLAFYFGGGRSTTRFPDPAIEAINASIQRLIPPGLVVDDQQLEQFWFTGTLQGVIFDLDSLQRLLNATPPAVDEASIIASALSEQAASVATLQQLIEIRASTSVLAGQGDTAAVLAVAFSQKAVAFANAAMAILPDIEKVIDDETYVAFNAYKVASYQRAAADSNAADAAAAKSEALDRLADTIIAVQNRDYKAAHIFADAATFAASLAASAALSATDASNAAFVAAQDAAQAAATAQSAIDGYFTLVSVAESCASDAATQASIASNAAQAAKSLDALAAQLGAAINTGASAALVAQINANTQSAIQSATSAAAARDQALAAAQQARSMGERVLFNSAAVYASQAAAEAAAALSAASQAVVDAATAQDAANQAQALAGGGGSKTKD